MVAKKRGKRPHSRRGRKDQDQDEEYVHDRGVKDVAAEWSEGELASDPDEDSDPGDDEFGATGSTSGAPRSRSLAFPSAADDADVDIGAASAAADGAVSQRVASKGGGTFAKLGLSADLVTAVKRKGYRLPTPIQRKAIPVALSGSDLVAMARTGSGKTAAFLLPVMQRLGKHSSKVGARAIVLSPTRELAQQTMRFYFDFARIGDLRACLLVGGDAIEEQFQELARNPDIIIATPGRFLHVITETGLSLRTIEMVVFDEADRLFEMGFAEEIKQILQRIPEHRQSLLFSATMPKMLVEFSRAGLREPEMIRLDTEHKLSENLRYAFFHIRRSERVAALLFLLSRIVKPNELTMVFVATRHHVEYLNLILTARGVSCVCVYGTMDPTARKIATARFRNGEVPLMVVTDVAARGIDIPLLDNVINYDFPPKPKLFVHRVGRVARAGRSGTAYSLVGPDEVAYMVDLHMFLGRPPLADTLGSVVEEEALQEAYHGRLPADDVEILGEELADLSRLRPDITSQERSMNNAHKLFVRTRAVPSRESARRAAELDTSAPHPLFPRSQARQTRIDTTGIASFQFAAAGSKDSGPTGITSSAETEKPSLSRPETKRERKQKRKNKQKKEKESGNEQAKEQRREEANRGDRESNGRGRRFTGSNDDGDNGDDDDSATRDHSSSRNGSNVPNNDTGNRGATCAQGHRGHGESVVVDDEVDRDGFVSQLREFRPAQTVLEAEIGSRRKAVPSGAHMTPGAQVMQRKRRQHAYAIHERQREEAKRSGMKSRSGGGGSGGGGSGGGGSGEGEGEGEGECNDSKSSSSPLDSHVDGAAHKVTSSPRVASTELTSGDLRGVSSLARSIAAAEEAESRRGAFRDNEFFLSATPSDRNAEDALAIREKRHHDQERVEDAILDLVPDASEDILRKKQVRQWDRKRKRFVQVNAGVPSMDPKRRKNEAGRSIRDGYRTDSYRRWSDRSKIRIQQVGETEDRTNVDLATSRSQWTTRTRVNSKRRWHTMGTALHGDASEARDELRSEEQIRRERREKEKRRVKSRGGKRQQAPNRTKGGQAANRGAPTRSKMVMRR